MEISWYGLSCFRITEKGYATVITDPYWPSVGLNLPKLKAEIVTISHDAPGHNYDQGVAGYQKVITGPGEYEIGGVFIIGVATHDDAGQRNVHFLFNYGGITIAHLGDMTKVPTQPQIESLGAVDVLLLPVGGGNSLHAGHAAEVVSILEPKVVIPMHYKTPDLGLNLEGVDRFLKEMGLSDIGFVNSLRITSADLDAEETKIVLLTPKQ